MNSLLLTLNKLGNVSNQNEVELIKLLIQNVLLERKGPKGTLRNIKLSLK